MKLLIIGASGLIGGALYNEALQRDYPTIGTYLNYPTEGLYKLDYGNRSEINKLLDDHLIKVILCPGGKTDVDWIEQNPKEAWNLNVGKLNTLFEIASERQIPLAFFSSDYIFDGKNGPYTEDDMPNPLNLYGSHKYIAETMLKTFMPKKYFIFRTTSVFGQEKQEKNFVYTVVKNLSLKKELRLPYDLFCTPTYVLDIARFALTIIEKNEYGTYNLSGYEYITRVDFAKNIAKSFKLNESLIIPVQFSSTNYIAARPLKAGLKNDKATNTTRLQWTPLNQALSETRREMEIEQNKEDKKSSSEICIFIPCFNAATTLPKVLERIPNHIKDKVKEILIVDNKSVDHTHLMAVGYRQFYNIKNLTVFKNVKNFGYGGSQKLAYAYASKKGYDMVVMLHGDAQYAPEKLPEMIEVMEKDKSVDLLFCSRVLGNPLKGGMPLHRFIGNKVLTFLQNFFLRTKISEFHSGYRMYRVESLKKVPFHLCSNDYHFDTEIMILFIKNKFKIREIPIETFYGDEKCYVNIWKYGILVLLATFCYYLSTKKIRKYELYNDGIEANIDKIFEELKTEIH